VTDHGGLPLTGGPAGGAAAVTIRLAGPSDVSRLAALLAAGSLRAGEDPAHLAPYRSALAEIAATEGNEVLVAELGGEVVGMCQLIVFRHLQERGGRCAEIESVHVDERHRSAGIGTTLLRTAVARAQAAGCYRVQLTSHKSRAGAHRFYERHGFDASHEGFKRYLR
jgi:ribosomal protein S18 acetylase RimI-like enzyme